MKWYNRHIAATSAALFTVALLALSCPASVSGRPCLVRDGRVQADIVIAEHPPRMVTFAAAELQSYIEKISGAKLTITNVPGRDVPMHVYVGRSSYTDELKTTDEGLRDGAFRMASGRDWFILLGHDSDFTPKEPRLRNGADGPRLMAEWDKATGETWGFPYLELWKSHSARLGLWEQDERGSLNAVYEFLRMLGARWYFPGDLGEIIPKTSTIEVPAVNRTVRPDFALRYPYIYYNRFGSDKRDEILWQLRLGFNQAPDRIGPGYLAHGTALVIERDEVKKAHPEYYALIGGKRQNGDNFRPCLSSEGLFQANVRFVRAVFDIFDAPMVSVMPTDGFGAICQCELCKNKATPERGWDGIFSDYVWDYVNRVAQEAYKTHPGRKIVGMAYSTYLLPPTKIATLSPNLVVCMEQRRSALVDPGRFQKYMDLRKGWLDKLPAGRKEFIGYDYYRHGINSPGMPVFFPHTISQDLRLLKGISMGDYIEVYRDKQGVGTLAVDHVNLYVTARCWWDAGLDVDALLEEYYTLFYGPARDEMKAFITFCEGGRTVKTGVPDVGMGFAKDAASIDKLFELLGRAQAKVPAESAYGRRIMLIADYVAPLKGLRDQLARGRDKDLPEAQAAERSKADITLDGRLDDAFWKGARSYPLKELQRGKPPASPSSFSVAWASDAVYLGIRCTDSDVKGLNIGATRNEDTGIWSGDCVEILLETQRHSYYQIVVNPAGALMDLDRKNGLNSRWASGAEVATHVGDSGWTVEMRIPVVGEMQDDLDPLHGVAGRQPSALYPWFFNVCRQRVRESGTERSAFSPTGTEGFQDVMKFGKLYVR